MKVYDEVKQILESNKESRNSDWKLFEIVYTKRGMGTSGYISWSDLKTINLESYRRARQKVQELNPHLQADETVKSFRNNKESKKGYFVFHEDGVGQLL